MKDKSLKVLVIEDDPIFSIYLETTLKKIGFVKIQMLSSAEDAMNAIQTNKPDLIFSDIMFEGQKMGLDVAAIAIDEEIPIILMTMLKDIETYVEALDIGRIAYLVKPFHLITLESTIELVLSNHSLESSKDKILYIQGNRNEKLRIAYNDIVWIEVDRNYCTIQTKNSKFSIKYSLQAILNDLNDERFMRIHNRYVINLNHLKTLHNNFVQSTKGQVPLGRTYKKALLTTVPIIS